MPFTELSCGVRPWKNGSKTFSRSASGMPGPSSWTSMRTVSSRSVATTTRRLPPRGENFTAFEMRFPRIAASLSRSASIVSGGHSTTSRTPFATMLRLCCFSVATTSGCSGTGTGVRAARWNCVSWYWSRPSMSSCMRCVFCARIPVTSFWANC